jgi:hypothetical protein
MDAMQQDSNRADSREPRRSGLQSTIMAAIFLYLLPLVAVAIDEIVLKTYWIVGNFPDGSRSLFFDVYPFLRFLES